MWRELVSWAFGFASIPVIVACIALIPLWFQIPDYFGLSPSQAGMGAALFIALVIIAVTAIVRVTT